MDRVISDMKKPIIIFLISAFTSCSTSNTNLNPSAAEKTALILGEMVENSDTPGLQYIIATPDKILFRYTGGISNLETHSPMTDATTLHGFSVTKTFTSMAILKLEAEGKLRTEDYIQTYLPDLPYQEKITVRQLMNHTSGIPNPLPLNWSHLISEHENFDYDKFIRDVLADNNELDDPPGEEYAYSNIGYLLLGEIIKQVSGEAYTAYIRNHIIKPLHLSDDGFLGFTIPDTINHARGYIKKWSFLNFGLNFMFDKSKFMEDSYDGWTQFKYFYINGSPHGGMIGNARGFMTYLQAILTGDVLLSNTSKQKMFQPQKTNNGDPIDMCLGWFRGELNGQIYFAHAGGGGGYYCEIRVYPEINLASVIMLNRTGVSDDRILDTIDHNFVAGVIDD